MDKPVYRIYKFSIPNRLFKWRKSGRTQAEAIPHRSVYGSTAQSHKIKFGNTTRMFFAVSLPSTDKGWLIKEEGWMNNDRHKRLGQRPLQPFGISLFIHPQYLSSGAVAQLEEHLLCKQAVVGSSPIGSTSFRSTSLPPMPQLSPVYSGLC